MVYTQIDINFVLKTVLPFEVHILFNFCRRLIKSFILQCKYLVFSGNLLKTSCNSRYDCFCYKNYKKKTLTADAPWLLQTDSSLRETFDQQTSSRSCRRTNFSSRLLSMWTALFRFSYNRTQACLLGVVNCWVPNCIDGEREINVQGNMYFIKAKSTFNHLVISLVFWRLMIAKTCMNII